MAVSSFIPELWAKLLLAHLQKEHVYAGLCNRMYEGEIRNHGDKVKINTLSAISISKYTAGSLSSGPETLTTNDTSLEISEADAFNFKVEDIDRAQAAGDLMAEAMRLAADGLNDKADQYVAGLYTEAAGKIGDDSSPIVPTISNAYDHLVDLNVLLDEANVPRQGRFVVVPSWYHALMLKDPRFISGSAVDQTRMRVSGYVGEVAGLTVYKSNNVPNTANSKYKIMAGHSVAITFAEQLTHMEAYRPEDSFADAVKGLHVYGAKVVRPNALAVLTVNKS